VKLRIASSLPTRQQKGKTDGELKEIIRDIEKKLNTPKYFCFVNPLLRFGQAIKLISNIKLIDA